MSHDNVARWVLTVVFAGTGSYFALRSLAAGRTRWSPDEVVHAVMAAAMITMVWPWAAVPALGHLVAFGGATVWYLARALRAGPTCGAAWYHAAMTGAMVWMAVAMSAPAAMPHGHPGAHATGPPPGSGALITPDAVRATVPLPTSAHDLVPSWTALWCLVLGVLLSGAAAGRAVAAIRTAATAPVVSGRRSPVVPGWRSPVVGDLTGAIMAVAMAVSLFEMV